MKALIVEDDPTVRGIVEVALRRRNHNPTAVADGDAAWNAYQREAFPLVVIDWMIPGIDGIELCRRIRGSRQGERTVILFITARTGPDIVEQVLAAGADDYVAKPLEIKRLDVALAVSERRVRQLVERRIAEGQMHELTMQVEQQARMLEEILAASPHHVCLLSPDGAILYVSQSAAKLFGRRREDLVGRTLDALDLPRDVADRLLAGQEAARAGVRNAAGEIKWSDDYGERYFDCRFSPLFDADDDVGAIVYSAWDITERKQSEEALRRIETRFRSLIENALDVITIVGSDGRIQYESPSILRIAGYTDVGLIGRSFEEFVHPDDTLAVRAALHTPAPERSTANFRFLHQSGEWLEFEAIVTNFLADPFVGGVVINARDVTERKRLEAQINRTQRLESLGSLAGGIAHDFNNIIGIVSGFADISSQSVPEDSPVGRNLRSIKEAINRAKDLVGQILTFSRKSQPRLELVPLARIAEETVRMIDAVRPANVELEFLERRRGGLIVANPTQLHQVLMNLCTNALHAMKGSGGRLDIVLDIVEVSRPGDSRYSGLLPGPYFEVIVKDTGQGMKPETVERIFEPFFTTKPAGEGTGMGLAVVHGVIEGLGGQIFVESALGAGTTFRVCLPCPALLDSDSSAPSVGVAMQTLLCIDDEPMVGEAIKRMLAPKMCEVRVAITAAAGLESFSRSPDEFDAVLIDQTMPRASGIDLARSLRAIRGDVPIVLLASSFDESAAREGAADDLPIVLPKPFTASQLETALAAAAGGRADLQDAENEKETISRDS